MELKQLLAALKEAQRPGSQLIAAVESELAGKGCQARYKSGGEWIFFSDFGGCATLEYRPAPEPRHIWVNEYPDRGVRYYYTTQELALACRTMSDGTLHNNSKTVEYVEVIK